MRGLALKIYWPFIGFICAGHGLYTSVLHDFRTSSQNRQCCVSGAYLLSSIPESKCVVSPLCRNCAGCPWHAKFRGTGSCCIKPKSKESLRGSGSIGCQSHTQSMVLPSLVVGLIVVLMIHTRCPTLDTASSGQLLGFTIVLFPWSISFLFGLQVNDLPGGGSTDCCLHLIVHFI